MLPDTVVGKQCFVFINARREPLGEVINEIEQGPFTVLIQPANLGIAAKTIHLVLGHGVGKIAVDTAWPVVGRVHPCPRDGLVAVHKVFTLAKGIKKDRHGTHIETVGTDPQKMVQDACNFVEHDPDVLSANRNLHAHELLDGHNISMLVAHHGDIVEPVHVGHGLQKGLGLSKFFRAPMKQPNVRIGALHHLTIELEHKP